MKNTFLTENRFPDQYASYAYYLRAFAESRTSPPLNWQLCYARKDDTNIFSAVYNSQEGTERYELEVRLTVDRKTKTYLYEVVRVSENLQGVVDRTPVQK